MLRDKYIFTYGKRNAAMIADSMLGTNKMNTTLFFLCMLTLAKPIDKLVAFSRGVNAKKEIKITLGHKEALAFHLAYKNQFLDNDNILLTEIFTAIDRTL